MHAQSLTRANVDAVVRSLRQSAEDRERVRGAVADIIEMVREGGDEAVRRLTTRLDGVELTGLRVAPEAIRAAPSQVESDVGEAIELLAANLRATAAAALPADTREVLPHGQIVSTRRMPVDRAGIYAPGGRFAYPSSVVMGVVPAQVAGVPGIAVCSPPGPDGLPHRSVLAACALLGVNEVYAIGGAQAIAALALGTESIPRVDMLVGPGNTYVEAAKRQLFGEVGIESLAGPSELVVLADETPSAELIAWDLRAQAEHGSGALAVLVATDHALLEAVAADLGETEAVTLIEADSLSTALAFVNAYAPEHLQLMVADAAGLLGSVRHAGAIFVGESSGTAYGDYVAGSNHILPTGATARFASGLSPAVFVRTQEIVEIPPAAAAALARPLAALARAEGLEAHARSAEVRAERIAEQDTSLEKGAAT